jgi:hypothetical protein
MSQSRIFDRRQGSATAESTCESLIVPVQFGLVAVEAGAGSSAFRVE